MQISSRYQLPSTSSEKIQVFLRSFELLDGMDDRGYGRVSSEFRKNMRLMEALEIGTVSFKNDI